MDKGWSGGGWSKVPDLTNTTSGGDIATIVAAADGAEPAGLVAALTGQLYALGHRMKVGDLVVMPRKTTKDLALGRVTSTYQYLAEEDPGCRHVVGVRWEETRPRTAVKQDLHCTGGS